MRMENLNGWFWPRLYKNAKIEKLIGSLHLRYLLLHSSLLVFLITAVITGSGLNVGVTD